MMVGKAQILYLQGLLEIDKSVSKGICPACLEPINNHYVDTFKIEKKKYSMICVKLKRNDEFQCCSYNSPLAKVLGLKK